MKVWTRRERARYLGIGSTILVIVAITAILVGTNIRNTPAEATSTPRQQQSDHPNASRLTWFRSADLTVDGQLVLPWRLVLTSWNIACDDWTPRDGRRVVIFTSFHPDTLMVQLEDPEEPGKWSIQKTYPAHNHGLHITGERIKGVRMEVDVARHGRYARPAPLIENEYECFKKLIGLPASLLDGQVSGRPPDEYSMVVDTAEFGGVDTVARGSDGTPAYGRRHLGTITMSETFWSAASRQWIELLSFTAVLLAICTYAAAKARSFRRRLARLLHRARVGRDPSRASYETTDHQTR